jgi:hypothetical protein
VLADEDGIPEALRMASCGPRVFVQLRRVDHESGANSALPGAIAVIDMTLSAEQRIVDADPLQEGVQAIALNLRPDFDMPVDCAGGTLYVAEPLLFLQGGGGYEQVDLDILTASELPIDTGAQVGGFEYVGGSQYWIITHTTTGPAPSSHLNLIGGGIPDTYNTFFDEHVNDLAYAADEDLLFFPDPCVPSERNPTCHQTGVQPFHAHSGELARELPIPVGFSPIEVVVAR